jgi:ABC-type branched-subunit amino acid transport system substrate-binding protein
MENSMWPGHQRLRALLGATLTILLTFFAFSFVTGWKAHAQPTTQEDLKQRAARGKQIYLQGTSASGKEILAYLGESSLEVSGSAMPCANCHGLNGQGKPEGGVEPSNLTWEFLTKPYGSTHAGGRRHGAYTERGLELAITRGTDPGGNKLLSVMPRYQMTSGDMVDLIAYLKLLGKDRDPGIYDDKIVIGTAVPGKGVLGEMGLAVKAAITAYFEELNSQGGLYGRRLELKSIETGETPALTRANFEKLFNDDPVFAMTGAFIAGAEKELLPFLAQRQVPLIGPLTLNPQTGLPLNRQVFYLLSGTSEQVRALLAFAATRPNLQDPGIGVVYPRTENNATALEAIKDQSRKQSWQAPQSYDFVSGQFDPAAVVAKLKQANGKLVVFLGSAEEALSMMKEAEKLNWFPTIFMPSANAGSAIMEAPAGFEGKLFLSFPTSPADQTAEGISQYRALAEKYKLPTKHVAAQLSVLGAAKILVEALKGAGKDLSREELLQILEKLNEYKTGLTPSISYGPNRRVGAMGAYIVAVNLKVKQLAPASGWISIN